MKMRHCNRLVLTGPTKRLPAKVRHRLRDTETSAKAIRKQEVMTAWLSIALLQALLAIATADPIPTETLRSSPPTPTATPSQSFRAIPVPMFTVLPTPTPPRSSPAPTPSATPSPPLGAPRQFSRPVVHPVSPQNVDVLIQGPPHDPTPRPTTFPDPRWWPIGLPALQEPDGSSAIDVLVFDHNGSVVARGIPKDFPQGGYQWFEDESFNLDHVLAPGTDAYTVTARYRDDPSYDGSSQYLILNVPAVEPRIGSPYILIFPNGAPISTIFYVRSIKKDGDRTFLTLRTRGAHRVQETVVLPQDRWMVGPMVVSSDIVDVRRRYLGTNAVPYDANLTCYNAGGEGARVALVPRKHVHIDLIARAAHTTTWIPNDTRNPIDCYGACDGKTGTFVESPLIVGFSVQPSDVRIIPPTMITRLNAFHGQCIRGYIVLRDPQQVRDIFTIVP